MQKKNATTNYHYSLKKIKKIALSEFFPLIIQNIVQYYILYLALGDFRVSLSSVGWP